MGELQTSKRWLKRHVVYNSDHFRDRNFSTDKEPTVTRIAVLGDSFAFGWGVEEPERFSNLLEQKLNSQNPGEYEVYNTSIPGWESKNQLKFLKQRAGMFDFDIIILSYVLNDIYNDRAFEMDSYSPKLIHWRNQVILKPILDKSFFLEFFFSKIFSLLISYSADISKRQMILYQDPGTWNNHTQTLRQIINYAKQNNQQLIVVIFPYLDLVSKDPYPVLFVHQKLNRFFKANNIQAIDLYNHLKEQPAAKLKVNPFDTHPSPFIHQITAELLFSSLSSSLFPSNPPYFPYLSYLPSSLLICLIFSFTKTDFAYIFSPSVKLPLDKI